MTVTYLVGDVFDQLATIPDGSISLVATSPPFIALRSYLPADHPDKDKEIGSEPNPGAFIDTLLALTAEWGRVLAPWGSIAIELGDTYSGSGGGGGDYLPGGIREGQQQFADDVKASMRESNAAHWRHKNQTPNAWPKPKCLALVPQAYALSLAYGMNVLTGQPSPAGQWLVRNIIVWHRPNPAVGALGDKYRPSTSYITIATRSPKRWFDLTAVRELPRPHSVKYGDAETRARHSNSGYVVPERGDGGRMTHGLNPAGAPPLDTWTDHHDTWTLTTQPSSLAHYAMWPARLAERLILSMCPASVCSICGEPRRRIETKSPEYAAARASVGDFKSTRDRASGLNGTTQYVNGTHMTSSDMQTVGWTDCGHNAYQPGHVLDPFCGTATTCVVAHLHGRNATGIDIDSRNRDLMPKRLEECRKALFGTEPEIPGQLDMFGEGIPA